MTSVSVSFAAPYPWALAPRAARVDRERAKAESALLRDSFRWVRRDRAPEFCPPWTMGQELGWRVCSPVDVAFTPLEQVEVESGNDPQAAATAAGASELWQREGTALAVSDSAWLHLYQYRSVKGHWENMFLPNGQGTVEWRLGWTVQIPRGYFLLVLPPDTETGIQVPVGILSSTVCDKMVVAGTAAIAIRPTEAMTVHRGQEIARLVLLHADSLRARATYPDAIEEGESDA
ncbi:hypothetical protein [Plantactinospora sp. KLBMP9567]|uniref:hypothetical protein n=1 Tax=Plantactinospora sp. KLBMP9567 TaxID=3085900 RepID=UPI002981D8F8|nr:hypothetical protein [Plantactinospora sp. KLBMP9567]MDW5327145.1 hypothetical protein [Plantactinospora sp. KLBMP9567]